MRAKDPQLGRAVNSSRESAGMRKEIRGWNRARSGEKRGRSKPNEAGGFAGKKTGQGKINRVNAGRLWRKGAAPIMKGSK